MYLVSRTETFAKLFFLVSFTGLFMYIALAFYSFHTAFSTVSDYEDSLRKLKKRNQLLDRFNHDLKYIALWTSTNEENNPIGEGQKPFIDSNCSDINCYLTTNKTILNKDYTNFDAIIFNISILRGWNKGNLPRSRLPQQKYIFHGMESSENYPLCNIHLDNYFNWTWSYKLQSDIFTPFIEVRNLKGIVVAPRVDVTWKTDIRDEYQFVGTPHPVNATKGNANFSSIDEINIKTKALAWIINKCSTKVKRMVFAKKLQIAMKHYSLAFDIYGCGHIECPEGNCGKIIDGRYYFYLAYEDSVSEDYVTQEVLMAYNHDAVPIVVGGANYSKFLPDNSYIDSKNYTPGQLAAFMFYLIKNPSVYHKYFSWKKYYTIHAMDNHKGLCNMCRLLNDKRQREIRSSHESFRKWWYYGSMRDRCYPKGAERFDEVFSYLKDSKVKKVK